MRWWFWGRLTGVLLQASTIDAHAAQNVGSEGEEAGSAGSEESSLPAQDELRGEPRLPAGLEVPTEEPGLPDGLTLVEEPGLPSGLASTEEPTPPSGLETHPGQGEPPLGEDLLLSSAPSLWTWSAFLDVRAGARTAAIEETERLSLLEERANFSVGRSWETLDLEARASSDLILDMALFERGEVNLETGRGFIDLREAYLRASPLDFVDLKVGRQLLTWGTGDLLFINDLFPKDWNALLIGRDQAYLKAPSDALKLSLFSDWGNIDLSYSPRFDADREPDRRRLWFWEPRALEIAGGDSDSIERPDRWFVDHEIAARAYQKLGSVEVAAYGYRGFWKVPAGMTNEGVAIHPRLSVYGLSARGAIVGGVLSFEGGYYDSESDREGEDPLIRNSEWRALVGFEREVASRLVFGLQFYGELMSAYESYRSSLPDGVPSAAQFRDVVSLRLRYSMFRERLSLNWFTMCSIRERDFSILPELSYVSSDHLVLGLGARIFGGRDDHTFLGQFAGNSSIYASARAAF